MRLIGEAQRPGEGTPEACDADHLRYGDTGVRASVYHGRGGENRTGRGKLQK